MNKGKPDKSRRMVLGGIAGGLLANSMVPASAQPSRTETPDIPLTNPADQYTQPPFPSQQQPWPGLTGKMTPRPDHGEESYKGSGRLKGRKALITGGDSGIGRAAAIAYAREGADVAINYLPAEEPDAREVAQHIRAAGRKAVLIPGDIRDEAFCKKLVQDAASELGGIDILVNNAARQIAHESILDFTTAQFDDIFKTNVYAIFWITKAAVPLMKPGAAIINTSSVVAYEPVESILEYSASKGAVMVFTKGLAKQLASKGIRVNAVAPGPFWTPLQVTGGQLPDQLPSFGKNTPMERPGQPAELAGIYVLLASNESSYATGQVYAATGGRGGP